MATKTVPTNERIVKMLEQVLRELDEVKKRQERLAADLRTTGRG